jgi:hypothetical protein
MRVTADVFYNVTGCLTIASALVDVCYFWPHPGLLAKSKIFRMRSMRVEGRTACEHSQQIAAELRHKFSLLPV